MTKLWEIVNPGLDQILFANLGPMESGGYDCPGYRGDPREQPEFTIPIVF